MAGRNAIKILFSGLRSILYQLGRIKRFNGRAKKWQQESIRLPISLTTTHLLKPYYYFFCRLNRDIGLLVDMDANVLHNLITTVLAFDLGTISLHELSIQQIHPAKDHHHSHHDYQDSGDDFASLITDITSLIWFRWMSSTDL